jgi:hypothetical protein
MTNFTDTVAAVIEETFSRFPTVALSDGFESITFCLGTLFTENLRTDSALANAMVDAGLASDEDDGRKVMMDMLKTEHAVRTCKDAKKLLLKAGIRIMERPGEEPTRYSDAMMSDPDVAAHHGSILEEMTYFHFESFEKLLNGPSYVTDDARESIAYIFQMVQKLNRSLMPNMFYQFVQGMKEEETVR